MTPDGFPTFVHKALGPKTFNRAEQLWPGGKDRDLLRFSAVAQPLTAISLSLQSQ
jgi:hypothetical protein